MELSTSDEDMPQLFFEGRVFTESRDTFGSPIWIDRLDLNCYAQGARGTPRGSLTCKSHNVLRDAHCRRIEGVCGVAPGGEHDHRDPVAAEIRYLRVRYLARVFCCEERSAVGLTAYLGGLVDIYRLPWTPRALMRSMMDMAATCVCAQVGSGPMSSLGQTLSHPSVPFIMGGFGPLKEDGTPVSPCKANGSNLVPEPVAGFDPEVFAMDGAVPLVPGPELAEFMGEVAPVELDEGLPVQNAPVPDLEGFGAWVEAVMPTPLPQPVDVEPEVLEQMGPERNLAIQELDEMDAFMAELMGQ
ncbi:hypothetical protein OUZ56_031266 [Daphnia magna]|uniref:Uncharacterized protein n=1 Tax=Daphnia magna TaxID=35525 RepID=A0ABQ9ZTR9_9CRUS|nr:hypothetical protein OUZ56_031266 [Daphnia magna]